MDPSKEALSKIEAAWKNRETDPYSLGEAVRQLVDDPELWVALSCHSPRELIQQVVPGRDAKVLLDAATRARRYTREDAAKHGWDDLGKLDEILALEGIEKPAAPATAQVRVVAHGKSTWIAFADRRVGQLDDTLAFLGKPKAPSPAPGSSAKRWLPVAAAAVVLALAGTGWIVGSRLGVAAKTPAAPEIATPAPAAEAPAPAAPAKPALTSTPAAPAPTPAKPALSRAVTNVEPVALVPKRPTPAPTKPVAHAALKPAAKPGRHTHVAVSAPAAKAPAAAATPAIAQPVAQYEDPDLDTRVASQEATPKHAPARAQPVASPKRDAPDLEPGDK